MVRPLTGGRMEYSSMKCWLDRFVASPTISRCGKLSSLNPKQNTDDVMLAGDIQENRQTNDHCIIKMHALIHMLTVVYEYAGAR